jgi:hypothetical protein
MSSTSGAVKSGKVNVVAVVFNTVLVELEIDPQDVRALGTTNTRSSAVMTSRSIAKPRPSRTTTIPEMSFSP